MAPFVLFRARTRRWNSAGMRVCGLLLGLAPLGAFATTDRDPWTEALAFDNPAALQSFEKLRKAAPADSRLMLGYASALLNRQPETSANVEHAAKLLGEVSTDSHALASHRATARYLLGRIAQDHLSTPDLKAARDHYRAVMHDFPDHPLAGEAAVNLGYILRWDTPGSSSSEIADGLVKLSTEATAPTARRELLFLLGDVRRGALKDKRGARDALVEARKIGFETPDRNGDVDLLIASLSDELGDPSTAIAHYRAFIRDYPRDNRTTTVRLLAAKLEASLASHP